MGSSGVVRNSIGQWKLGFAVGLQGGDSFQTELLAVVEGLELCWKEGCKKIHYSTNISESNGFRGIVKESDEMRVIVPLQGVVQGTGGLFWGSVIPCALFYFLQLLFKTKTRHHHPPSNHNHHSTLHRSLSPTPRHATASAYVSPRANSITAANSPYYLGLHRVADDPYHQTHNPQGVIQLAFDQNTLSLDLIQEWIHSNGTAAMLGKPLSVSGIVPYQPLHGFMELKLAVARFMSRVLEKPVFFNPSRMVLTAGATSAIEILTFCLADHGNAFLVPTPLSPG
ncbi:probable aminotransferase ACS10 [Cajanus cajan]|uniref:probable aminotransferase ACS10 n=1 Tax=Cajanus cajan TaxID=3821 RepID=UPI00098DB4CD|nr:probable aminotransferase ACS10 [Cajanus cajan]